MHTVPTRIFCCAAISTVSLLALAATEHADDMAVPDNPFAAGCAVAPFLRLGNTFGRMIAPLNMHAPAGLLRADFVFNAGISPVGINIPARVVRVEQLLEDSGVGHGSMRDGDLADQLATLVDASMQFVPE